MKVTCQRDSLQSAVQAVSAAVPTQSTIPALKNLKATAEGDALSLVGYDPTQGVGVRYTLAGVTVARPGSCILPKDQLVGILRESSAPDIHLDAGKEAIVAKAGGRFEMPSLAVEEFPDFPPADDDPGGEGQTHEVSAGVLRTLLRRTAFAADKKESTARFALTGVLWEAQGRELSLVATDTKRLALASGPATVTGQKPAGAGLSIVPLKAVSLLERNLTGDDAEPVRVRLRANDALFSTERAVVYTALLHGNFPPYAKLLAGTKKAAAQAIRLPVGAFLAALRQAAVMADEESRRVDMHFETHKVTMKARGQRSGCSLVALELPEHSGAPVEAGFDPAYLIEFLKALGDEASVTLRISDGTKACLFETGEDYRYLVMPLTG